LLVPLTGCNPPELAGSAANTLCNPQVAWSTAPLASLETDHCKGYFATLIFSMSTTYFTQTHNWILMHPHPAELCGCAAWVRQNVAYRRLYVFCTKIAKIYPCTY